MKINICYAKAYVNIHGFRVECVRARLHWYHLSHENLPMTGTAMSLTGAVALPQFETSKLQYHVIQADLQKLTGILL